MTVGSQARYFVTIVVILAVCCCSLTTATFSSLTYPEYFDVSVCQPISSITNVSPFSVVGWPVPLKAS